MDNNSSMILILEDMEKIAQTLNTPSFSIYFLGGSACILGQYSDNK